MNLKREIKQKAQNISNKRGQGSDQRTNYNANVHIEKKKNLDNLYLYFNDEKKKGELNPNPEEEFNIRVQKTENRKTVEGQQNQKLGLSKFQQK